MDESIIELRGVRRGLGGRDVLAGVDLEIAAGETVALVGANGAGKSTLIRSLLDLRSVDTGAIRIAGREHTDRRARERLAYLPERFQPPYYLQGRGFIHYMLALYGVQLATGAVDALCAQLGLPAEALQAPVQTYSKGMSQMLGLAACLLSQRPLLVLDEPMSGLDPGARVRLEGVLQQQRAAGMTLLFTTHLLADVEALADRIAVLHQGRIVADASPGELTARYGGDDLEAAFVRCVGAAPEPA